MNRIWSVLIGPCFVLTVVPSIRGNKSLWTPSLETSPPTLSLLAETLSISSKKTIPFSSVVFFASVIILSSSIILSDSCATKISWDSLTVIFFFLPFLPPIDFPRISPRFTIPTFPPGIPGISKLCSGLEVFWTSISISLLSKSPVLNLFLKLSLVATLALLPTSESRTFSSAFNSAFALTSFLFFSLSIAMAISINSLLICSTSLPT